jgi:hypothetical protein
LNHVGEIGEAVVGEAVGDSVQSGAGQDGRDRVEGERETPRLGHFTVGAGAEVASQALSNAYPSDPESRVSWGSRRGPGNSAMLAAALVGAIDLR